MKNNTTQQWGTPVALGFSLLLCGCATPVYTVDDGSPVDEKLLSEIRTYAKGHQVLRPAIAASSSLKDKDCDKQWEIPFAVATSYDLPKEKRIAWARGAQADERLSIIAATEDSGLQPGDKIEELNGYKRENSKKMMEQLLSLRDRGWEFDLKLADKRTVKITPFEVCRGHVNIQPPSSEELANYHWEQSIHPLPLFAVDLTPDEATWMVLWTQGLSEEAGARMKTYHYGLKVVQAGMRLVSMANGLSAVANSANSMAAQAVASNLSQQVSQQIAQQVADSTRRKLVEVSKEMLKQQAQEMAVDSIKTAALFKSSLSGISWVAGAGFPMADKWAFERMAKLGADPLAGITLHYKLASRGISLNSFVFDEERVGLITQITEAQGLGNEAKLALGGNDPRDTLQVIEEYPAAEKAKQEGAQELAANLPQDGRAPVLPETPQGAATGAR